MQVFWTFVNGLKAVLSPQVRVVAGATAQDAGNPKLLRVDTTGAIVIANAPPRWDTVATSRYGSTNNIKDVIYSLNGSVVGTATITYAGGGAADDDDFAGMTKNY